MSNDTDIKKSLDELEQHLLSQLKLKERVVSFDMDDTAEARVLSPFPALHSALQWLDEKVAGAWNNANRKAGQSQSRHRYLARIAIGTGTAAVALAILQLTLKLTLKQNWSEWAAALEAVAVGSGVIAVVVGLTAKFNRQWFGRRHHAEQLRMLKFQSLGRRELWCGDREGWQTWIEGRLAALETTDGSHQVEMWSRQGEVEPAILAPPDCVPAPGFAQALAIYYRVKRLDFQADYFGRRRSDYERQTGGWRHLSLPFFFASVIFVLAHFGAEFWAANLRESGEHGGADTWEMWTIWFVAAAAVIPVLGFGVRAWFAAFELPRSASLFAAKQQALVRASVRLRHDAGDLAITLHHFAQAEHFLEHEHREWLRLLLDAEWFL